MEPGIDVRFLGGWGPRVGETSKNLPRFPLLYTATVQVLRKNVRIYVSYYCTIYCTF